MLTGHGRGPGAVNVIVLLQRWNDGRVLAVRRDTSCAHAPGLLTAVGGHLGDGEFADQATLRKAYEEVGVRVAPADLEFCQLVHYLAPCGRRRIGMAFTARRWEGEPYNREPTHTGLFWVDPGNPPPDCHSYTRTVLTHFVAGSLYANITAPTRPAMATDPA
ncbi:NUDIX domain-containing protein [Streptomyces olivoreticuli]